MKVEFTLEKCQTKATYSAKPKRKGKIDLNVIRKRFEIIVDTPFLVMVNVKGIEVIVHGYGELLFKKCDDADLMKKIAEEIYAGGIYTEGTLQVHGK